MRCAVALEIEMNRHFTGFLNNGTPISVWCAVDERDARGVIARATGQIVCLRELEYGEQTPQGLLLDLSNRMLEGELE